MNEVLNFYKTFFPKDSTVIAAISGGPDSMALLDSLMSFPNLQIVVAHVNHKMRVESEEEEKELRAFCKKNDLVFECLHLKKKDSENFQSYARKERQAFFEALANKYHTPYILTAHHADDLMETILMRMVRGSSLKGYSGFSRVMKKKEFCYVKPLIHLTKEELLTYVKEKNLLYFVDHSNEKDTYTRNRYRKYVLPFLKEENPKVHDKFYQFHQELEECDAYFSSLFETKDKHKILLNEFLKEHPYVQKRWLYLVCENYYGEEIYQLEQKHLDMLLPFVLKGKTNTYLELPNGVKAFKGYEEFYLTEFQEFDYSLEFKEKLELPNDMGVIKVLKECEEDSNFVCRLSYDNVTFPLFVRTKKEKDRMFVKGMEGSRTISNIFTDLKVPYEKRQSYPILVDAKGQILWLPGLKKSKFDKTKNEKYDIILKYEMKGAL